MQRAISQRARQSGQASAAASESPGVTRITVLDGNGPASLPPTFDLAALDLFTAVDGTPPSVKARPAGQSRQR